MNRSRLYLAFLAMLLTTSWILVGCMNAQETNRAAVVVRHNDEEVRTVCVEFPEKEIIIWKNVNHHLELEGNM